LDSFALSRVPRRIESNAKRSHAVGVHVADGDDVIKACAADAAAGAVAEA
jgi:hypothetical protein